MSQVHTGCRAARDRHLSTQTTRGRVAVFDEDIVCHYRAHLRERRRLRPDHEYRGITTEVRNEFEDTSAAEPREARAGRYPDVARARARWTGRTRGG
ncbi:hypothetical protein [Streptomyces sp. NPDC001770]